VPIDVDPQAEAIAATLLKITEDAVLTDQFDLFQSATQVPYVMSTYEGEVVYTTLAELEAAFRAVVAYHALRNVSSLQRDLLSASFTSETEIKFAYVTRRLSGHLMVEEAYPSIATADLVDGQWKIKASEHAKPGSGDAKDDLSDLIGAGKRRDQAL
jgi:hypothetical protein